MFGFGKKKKQQEEDAIEQGQHQHKAKKGKMDKLIMGAIMGVAVGSVIGMAVAPKKSKEAIEKGKESGHKFIEDHQPEKQKAGNFFSRLIKILTGKSSRKKNNKIEHTNLKNIPNEVDVDL